MATLMKYSYKQPIKRKWYERLLGLNKPKYEWTMFGPFKCTIRR